MAAAGSRNFPNLVIAESKQCAPTGLLNPFLIFPSVPELAGLGPSVPYIHAPSEELLWGRALAISSPLQAGCGEGCGMRRLGGGGREGGTGALALAGSLTYSSFFFFFDEPPPGVPKVGGGCRFHIRATAEGAGLGGAGGEGSIFLCLSSVSILGSGVGATERTGPRLAL